MYLVVVFLSAGLLCSCSSATVKQMRLLTDLDNNIEITGAIKPPVKAKLLTITHHPEPSYPHKEGDAIHLVCEALGAPSPSIHWFKNDAPVYEFESESNELVDGHPSSVARVSSTLLVTRASEHDEYTCLAAAGTKTVRATTVVYSIDGSTELSERSKLYPLIPQVVVWYKVYVDTIGNNVVIPCRAKGHPRPKVSWTSNKGLTVKNEPRMKVLRSGALSISSIRWSDMGEWECRATNMFGDTRVKTFLYPAKAG